MPNGDGDWYVLRVELISGSANELDPPPGRDFLVSPQHSFRQLADAINTAFARWDLGHLSIFHMPDGSLVSRGLEDVPHANASRTRLGEHAEGDAFVYEFDLGDSWLHRCTVIETGVDPVEMYGFRPKKPVAVWGWGAIPDQHGRTTPHG
jgi:hypothetical protein